MPNGLLPAGRELSPKRATFALGCVTEVYQIVHLHLFTAIIQFTYSVCVCVYTPFLAAYC